MIAHFVAGAFSPPSEEQDVARPSGGAGEPTRARTETDDRLSAARLPPPKATLASLTGFAALWHADLAGRINRWG